MPPKRALIMHPEDNVVTVVEETMAGEEVAIPLAGGTSLTLIATETIPFGFKLALRDIPQGEIIRKYGETIGRAGTPILKGAMVHVHNLEGTRSRGDLEKGGER
ncbi:MAG: UxaA family hydrolase [Syntrophales bacterium]|nr:UxaA family hydrolase [Syntrophales bacterium]